MEPSSNIIGQDAEDLVKTRIKNWLKSRKLILEQNADATEFRLPNGYTMRYGSEPDILFKQAVGGGVSMGGND